MKSNEIIVAQAGDTCLYQEKRGFFRLIETGDKIQFGQRQVNTREAERLAKLRGMPYDSKSKVFGFTRAQLIEWTEKLKSGSI